MKKKEQNKSSEELNKLNDFLELDFFHGCFRRAINRLRSTALLFILFNIKNI